MLRFKAYFFELYDILRNMSRECEKSYKNVNNKNPKYPQKDKSKPNIKPLSARFKNIDE